MLLLSVLRQFGSGFYRGVLLACLVSFLVACTSQGQTDPTTVPIRTTAVTITPEPVKILSPTTTDPFAPSATITVPQTLFLSPDLPDELVESINLSGDFKMTSDAQQAGYSLTQNDATGSIHWVYALVAPFPTITSTVTLADLQSAWSGTANKVFSGSPILMDASTHSVFSTAWGAPEAKSVRILPSIELLAYAWGHQPAWALIPFGSLEPEWKVLNVDGQSPLHKDFNPATYPLSISFSLQQNNATILSKPPEGITLPSSNYDPSRLTVVAMTGVTALVRGTALWMERYGITYPAQDVGPLLRQADITHISNEIPFVPDCPFPSIPNPVPTGQPQPLISFCSSPNYIALLEEVGADVVEITGDHFADWGDAAMQYTLELYESQDLPVYGGGMDAEQARQPLLVEKNGNRLAFLGCNIGWPVRKDQIPQSALATAYHPGAAQCDFAWLNTEIHRLRSEGYQVIFTFQHREYDRMRAEPPLVYDFKLIASYGATIVSGSQAHQPHSLTFENDAFIHYGLGNLFFDQYHFCADYACDYAFIDLHYFYDNRYLSTQLVPIVFIDLARPRLMTEAEGGALLEKIFSASDWKTSP